MIKNKNKRFIVSLVFGLILCLVFSSCTGNNNEKPSPTKEEETVQSGNGSVVDLTPESKKIVVWLGSNDPEFPEVNEFIRLFPDYEVDNSVAVANPFMNTDYDQELQRLGAAIATSEQPDLFMAYVTPLEAFYSNLFMPVHEYLEVDPEYNFDTVEPAALKSCSIMDKVYFIPTAYDVPLMVWCKNLFESVGLDPETPPRTWSELKQFSEKLVTYDTDGKIKTIGAVMLDWWTFHLINNDGKQYTDETGLTLNINTPEYNNAIEYIRSLPEVYGGSDKLPDSGISFFNGTMGISCMTSNGATALTQWMAPNLEFGLAPMPGPDDGGEYYSASGGGNLLCIPKKAKNPKGGWMYIKYKMTEAAYVEAVEAYNKTPNCCIVSYLTHIPTRERLYEEFETTFTEKSWELIRARDEIVQKANLTGYTVAVHRKFYNYYMEEFDKVMSHEISPKEYLANIEAYGRQLIKEFKDQKTGEGWTFNDDGTIVPPPED